MPPGFLWPAGFWPLKVVVGWCDGEEGGNLGVGKGFPQPSPELRCDAGSLLHLAITPGEVPEEPGFLPNFLHVGIIPVVPDEVHNFVLGPWSI